MSKQSHIEKETAVPLTIVANIYAKPGKEELVLDESLKLVGPTREEQGCIQYDLHRDNSALGHLVFYENWESRELWQTHRQAPHLAAYAAATEGAVDQFILNEMERLA